MGKQERAKLYGHLVDECAYKIKAIYDGSFLKELHEKIDSCDQEAVLNEFYDHLYNHDRLINNICMLDLETQGLDVKSTDKEKRKELQKHIVLASMQAPETIDNVCKGVDFLIKTEPFIAAIDEMFALDLQSKAKKIKDEVLQAALMPTMFERIYELIGLILEDYEQTVIGLNYKRSEMDDGYEDMEYYKKHLQTTFVGDPTAVIPQLTHLITYGSQRATGNEVKV